MVRITQQQLIVLLGIGLVLALIERSATFAVESGRAGSILGQLSDSDGQAYRVGNAVVFLCDAATGMPLAQHDSKPIELGGEPMFDFSKFRHAITEDSGAFEFEHVPVGTYRLVAQAWSGISGMPRGLPGSRRDPGQEPSSIIILHGVAESVRVEEGEKTRAFPRQQGRAVARIGTDPAASHNFLLLSRNPRLGEGSLGPFGWGTEFITGVFALTRMEDHHVTFIGLAEGAEVHTGLWNYDNLAGTGGNTFVVGQDQPARIPIYAGWSDGKYEPTPRLAKLTEHIERKGLDIVELTGLGEGSLTREYFELVGTRAKEQVDVPGYGQASVIDLLAADGYRQGREYRRKREERRAARRAKQMEQADRNR